MSFGRARILVRLPGPTTPNDLHLFSAFRHVLSSLAIANITIQWSALVSLVDYFPNLNHLGINGVTFDADSQPVHYLSRPSRGWFTLWAHTIQSMDLDTLVTRLPELNPEYSEFVTDAHPECISRVLTVFQKSLKCLSIFRYRLSLYLEVPVDLSYCPELEEISIHGPLQHLGAVAPSVSSITSTKFRRVVLAIMKSTFGGGYTLGYILSKPFWSRLDDVLVEVADRLRRGGHSQTLEVEVQVVNGLCGSKEGIDERKFLPGFREKGKVTIFKLK